MPETTIELCCDGDDCMFMFMEFSCIDFEDKYFIEGLNDIYAKMDFNHTSIETFTSFLLHLEEYDILP